MNASDSRLYCERCHGTGYVSTALGKLPCLACSASELVSNSQEQSGPTRSERNPDSTEERQASVEQSRSIGQNSTGLAGCFVVRFDPRKEIAFARAVINDLSVTLYRKPAMPFAGMFARHDLEGLKGHDEFSGIHIAIEADANWSNGIFAMERNDGLDSISSSICLARVFFGAVSSVEAVSRCQEMSGEQR